MSSPISAFRQFRRRIKKTFQRKGREYKPVLASNNEFSHLYDDEVKYVSSKSKKMRFLEDLF